MQMASRRLQVRSCMTSEVQLVLGSVAVMLRGLQAGSCMERRRCRWCGACCRWCRGSAGGQLHEAAMLQLVLGRLAVMHGSHERSAGGQLHAW